MPKKATPSFEQHLQELETLVEKLEKGDLSLDESMQHFERGIALARNCQKLLRAAEQKVEILNKNSVTAEPEPFNLNLKQSNDEQ